MSVITITEAAAAQLHTMAAGQQPQPAAVMVSVKSHGCSGMKYDLQFLKDLAEAPKFAEQVDANGLTVIVDPKAEIFITGSIMDYKREGFREGFDFTNPNETGRCGCGESFTTRPEGSEH